MSQRKIFLFILSCLFFTAAAQAGREGGNGGDACENRIQIIRNDIDAWIEGSGAAALQFPKGISLEAYVRGMRDKIRRARVSCVSEPLMLGGAEKTCLNYQDGRGTPRVKCNAERFMATSEGEQYILVHHEYAGLLGLEANNGDEASNYVISNQLSGSLEEATVKRLVIRNPKDKFDRLRRAFGDYLGTYEILNCSVSTSDSTAPNRQGRPDACQAKTLKLALSERFVERYGYRTVDTEYYGIPGAGDRSYNIAFANDGADAQLGHGTYFSPSSPSALVDLETSVRVVGGTYFFQTNRVLKTPGHEGEYTRVTVVARRIKE